MGENWFSKNGQIYRQFNMKWMRNARSDAFYSIVNDETISYLMFIWAIQTNAVQQLNAKMNAGRKASNSFLEECEQLTIFVNQFNILTFKPNTQSTMSCLSFRQTGSQQSNLNSVFYHLYVFAIISLKPNTPLHSTAIHERRFATFGDKIFKQNIFVGNVMMPMFDGELCI